MRNILCEKINACAVNNKNNDFNIAFPHSGSSVLHIRYNDFHHTKLKIIYIYILQPYAGEKQNLASIQHKRMQYDAILSIVYNMLQHNTIWLYYLFHACMVLNITNSVLNWSFQDFQKNSLKKFLKSFKKSFKKQNKFKKLDFQKS
jgi:hypothetical protein